MIYVKGVLIGFGTVLLECLVTPIALVIRASWKSQGGAATVSFSPMGGRIVFADGVRVKKDWKCASGVEVNTGGVPWRFAP